MQGGEKREICHEAFFMTVMSATFGALTEVHFLHDIYHFKAQEVKNPMLQTVHDSKLKRLPLPSGVKIPDVNIRVECGGNRV